MSHAEHRLCCFHVILVILLSVWDCYVSICFMQLWNLFQFSPTLQQQNYSYILLIIIVPEEAIRKCVNGINDFKNFYTGSSKSVISKQLKQNQMLHLIGVVWWKTKVPTTWKAAFEFIQKQMLLNQNKLNTRNHWMSYTKVTLIFSENTSLLPLPSKILFSTR